jgi:AraC-like DNA-binding protein/mannose-6-phosphate isomerase-like protein (cupin superfamily)
MEAKFEKIQSLEQRPIHAFAYEMEEFDAPWHYHPEFELTYIISSAGVRYVGNSVENFTAGDLVLIGPNLPHCWKNTGIRREKAAAVVIHWNHNLLTTDWLKQVEFDGIRVLLDRAAMGIRFDYSDSIADQLLNLPHIAPFQRFVSFLQILNALADTRSVSLCDAGFGGTPNSEDHERINRIYRFVRKNYTDRISLKRISDEIYMTEESFSRFFSKLMRKPFFTFLNEYRINAACKMLIESDADVSQAAYANGFESLPFFYRQFKRFKNMSPGEYRGMYRRI